MDEFALIDTYFSQLGAARGDVRLGVGDDAALVVPPPGQVAAIATDTVICGVHFPATLAPRAIGHRALAVNLSDLAAMGAEPAYALIALSLAQVDPGWLAEFSAGVDALAKAHAVAVVGGDTTHSEVLSITITAVGWLAGEAGTALTRRGARAGDLVAVSGSPGDAAAGLAALREHGASDAHAPLRERFAFPQPRVVCGAALRGVASAAIDVSDGLLADADKLARASAVHLALDARRLPLSAALHDCHGRDGGEHLALTGGDDYELLFTLDPSHAPLLGELAQRSACALTIIGEVPSEAAREGGPGASAWRDGRRLDLSPAGYRHFAP